jgi:hypothetical protein
MTNAYETREEWLNAFIEGARVHFEAANAPLPPNVRVSVGFGSNGTKGTRAGEIWADTASDDGHFEIFIRPTMTDVARICDVLTQQLIYAATGLGSRRGSHYRRVAASLGLEGGQGRNDYAPGQDWYAWALPLIDSLGAMPYAALTGGASNARKKQAAALRKVECPSCGWLARVTLKHIKPHPFLACPVPDCPGELICEDLSTAGEPDDE